MKWSRWLLAPLVAFGLLGQVAPACAGITWWGDLDPSNPGNWKNTYVDVYIGKTADGKLVVDDESEIYSQSSYLGYDSGVTGQVVISGAGSLWMLGGIYPSLHVGYNGNGTLAITNGGSVSCGDGHIGFLPNSVGKVTVSGAGWTSSGTHMNSTWTVHNGLNVGDQGTGTLAISNGGVVSVGKATYVGYLPSSTGTIAFGSGGGTLATGGLCVSPSQLTGTGTINTRGLISDVDLVVDSAANLMQTFRFNAEPDQDITVNVDMSGLTNLELLGAGCQGDGSLVIRNGLAVQSSAGIVGFHAGSNGCATVTGPGSTWTGISGLDIGRYGNGTLTISDGALVSTVGSAIGCWSGSTGEVTVSGVGSKWTHTYDLAVGLEGNGVLTISDRGTVTCSDCCIGYYNSVGKVTVSGAGSTFRSSGNDIHVGFSGSGMLVISDGASVTTGTAHIGRYDDSVGEAIVAGANSTWTAGSMHVGLNGNGKLTITDGGLVTCMDASIGTGTGSTCEATVRGVDSTWTIDRYLSVGGGSGRLAITNGAHVVVGIDASIGGLGDWKGRALVAGIDSTWTIDRDLSLGLSYESSKEF